MLALAGRHADIVGIMNTSVATGEVRVDPREFCPEAVERRVALIAKGAGDRFAEVELSHVADVIVSEDRPFFRCRRPTQSRDRA